MLATTFLMWAKAWLAETFLSSFFLKGQFVLGQFVFLGQSTARCPWVLQKKHNPFFFASSNCSEVIRLTVTRFVEVVGFPLPKALNIRKNPISESKEMVLRLLTIV
jgi:hypothetical protein